MERREDYRRKRKLKGKHLLGAGSEVDKGGIKKKCLMKIRLSGRKRAEIHIYSDGKEEKKQQPPPALEV